MSKWISRPRQTLHRGVSNLFSDIDSQLLSVLWLYIHTQVLTVICWRCISLPHRKLQRQRRRSLWALWVWDGGKWRGWGDEGGGGHVALWTLERLCLMREAPSIWLFGKDKVLLLMKSRCDIWESEESMGRAETLAYWSGPRHWQSMAWLPMRENQAKWAAGESLPSASTSSALQRQHSYCYHLYWQAELTND